MLHQVVSTPASDPTQDPLVEIDITMPSAPTDPDAALSAAEESANAAASSAEISKDFNSLEIIDKARLRANRGLSSNKKYANEPSFLTIQNWCRARGFTHWTWQFFGLGYNPAQAESLWKDSDLARWGIVAQDLINAGLWVSRQWEKIEWRQPNGTKDDISLSAETDNRIQLCGYRWVAGDCITVPVMHPRNPGQVMTWVNRRVGLPKTVREIAGDYRDDGPVIGKEQSLAIDDGRKYQYLRSPRKARIDKAGKLLDVAHQHVLWCPRWLDAYQESIPEASAKEAWQKKKDEEARERGEVVKDRKVWSTMKDVSESAWLVEGVPDCMAASQSGALACTAGGAFVPEAAIKELLPELKLHDKFHRNIYVGFDADPVPAAPKPGKILRLGAGVQGMLDFGARLLALEPELALRLHFVFLPAGPGGEKNDFAEVMLGVYKTLPEPGNTKIDLAGGSMEFPSGFFDAEWVAFHLQVMELQKTERERLESTAMSLPDAMLHVLEQVVSQQQVTAAQQMQACSEVGLLDLMRACPDLWLLEIEDKVATIFSIPKAKRKAWAKLLGRKATEDRVRSNSSSDDPLARHIQENGTIDPCYDGIRSLIEHIEAAAGVEDPRLWWNEMELQTFLGDEAMTDCKLGDFRTVLSRQWKCNVRHKSDLREVVDNIAQKNPKHPAREYFSNLKHDGRDCLPEMMDAMGLRPNSEDQNHLWYAEIWRWGIGVVARAHATSAKPVKFDNILTLVGGQGCLKSTWFEALCPVECWYGAPDISDFSDASSIKLAGLLIGVMEESNGTSYWRDIEKQKAWISKKTDRIIRKYVAYAETVARTWGLGATVNETQFLQDPTGFRRQWMLMITQKIDIARVKSLRDRFWAQCHASWLAGEQWWLTNSEEELHKADGAAYQAPNLELDKVRRFVNNQSKNVLMGLDVAEGIEIEQPSNGDSKRIKNHMIALGWEARPTNSGQRYTAPSTWRPGGASAVFAGANTPEISEFDLDNPPAWFFLRHG